MFPGDVNELYQSIRAPQSLRQKIEEKAAQRTQYDRKQSLTYILSTAACFAILAAAAIPFLRTPLPSLSVNGVPVSAEPVCVAMPFSAVRNQALVAAETTLVLELVLDRSEGWDIVVSHGSVEIKDGGLVLWTFPQCDELATPAQLDLRSHKKEASYLLFRDGDGAWYLEKQ